MALTTTPKSRAFAVLSCLRACIADSRVVGVVVNAIDFSNPAYGYEYYYRNYYRYGYTYGGGPDPKATT